MARARELPPHLDSTVTFTAQTEAKEAQLNAPQVGARGVNVVQPSQAHRESGQERARKSLASASASALLLSDLQRPATTPSTSGTSIRPNADLPPPAKRRRLTPPPGSSQTLSQTNASFSTSSTTPDVAVSDYDGLSNGHRGDAPFVANGASKSRTASTHAASPQAPVIKRERSSSPVIDADVPHLITEGCVRVAPLPPACKAGRAGYQNARREWTAGEAKKLRELGLKPTRVFIREDGMVIDWRSDVPVMSDTLRPPPPEDTVVQAQPSILAQVIDPSAGSSVVPARPSGSQGRARACPSAYQDTGEQGPSPATTSETAVSSNTHTLSSAMQRHPPPPAPRTLIIPAPGETIWMRVFPPSREPLPPPPLSPPLPRPADVARTAAAGARGPPLHIERSDRLQHRRQPATATADARQQISPDVEIIDLTEEANHDDSPSQDRPAFSHVNRAHISAAVRSQPAAGTLSTTGSGAIAGSIMDTDEMQRGAVAFLHRYLAGFMEDRSVLASAYSRVATFSVQTVSSTRVRPPIAASPSTSLVDALAAAAVGCAPSNPIDVDAPEHPAAESATPSNLNPPPPATRHQGRVEIIAALLDLPPLDAVGECSDSDSNPGSSELTVEWDLVHGAEAGDVLLICYAVTVSTQEKEDKDSDRPRDKRGRDKGKGKAIDRPAAVRANAEPPAARRRRICLYEQRFMLRPREWDKEDR
ncbi:hypothetical protein GY45DRAFT_1373524 [Cubamyces sp. BRFM 1775]|nr:hypothetical protein GY45DRAFT_1373524 [Cubamyces sp. BRFM 1775]